MNLEQLRAFLAVVRLGTLTRAAEQLQLSQSTLSFRIKGLEESVGSKLLDRGGPRLARRKLGVSCYHTLSACWSWRRKE